MLSGNYILLFKNLGKFCYVFENAGTTQATQQVAFDAMVEQAAKPSGAWEVISDLAPYITQLNTALQNGAVAIQSVIVKAAIAYLLTDTVAAYFVHTTPGNTVALMLTALSAEMTADTVTISETAASFPENGLFYFLNQINAAASTIPTAGSPTYTDATYVTESIL